MAEKRIFNSDDAVSPRGKRGDRFAAESVQGVLVTKRIRRVGNADSFIDFMAGLGGDEVFMQVNTERLRIFGDGSIITHGIIKGYALHTESGSGGAGGVAYLSGATILGGSAYLQSHSQDYLTIIGTDDDDLLEIEGGSLFIRSKASTYGQSLGALLGSYSVSDAALVAVSDTWASADDPDGTADGINTHSIVGNRTVTIPSGDRLLIPLSLAGTPAYDGLYTLTFKILHDTTNYTEPGLPVPDGDSLVSTVTIEASVDGGAYSDVGSAIYAALTDSGSATQEFTKQVDIGSTAPTTVSFRLKLSTTMQIDPANLSGSVTTHVRVYNATAIGTDPYDVTWTKTTGTAQARRGVQFFGVDQGTKIQPMFNMEPTGLTALPAASDGVEGDVIYVGGAINTAYYHNGTVWVAIDDYSATDHGGLSGLADDDHSQYLLASGTRALTGTWSAGQIIHNTAQPACRVYMDVSDLAISAGTWTRVPFGSEVFDRGSIWDATTDDRLEIPTGAGGLYLLHFQTSWPSAGSQHYKRMRFLLNGSAAITDSYFDYQAQDFHVLSITGMAILADGDYVEYQVYSELAHTLHASGSRTQGYAVKIW